MRLGTLTYHFWRPSTESRYTEVFENVPAPKSDDAKHYEYPIVQPKDGYQYSRYSWEVNKND